MTHFRTKTAVALLASLALLGGCSAFKNAKLDPNTGVVSGGRKHIGDKVAAGQNTSIFDAFKNGGGSSVKVNRYLWTASLQILDFLPVESADPFTGIITTGYGTPPGGGTAYRATILVSDPALDARSLNVSLQTRRGAVSADTQRKVEDAILTRARQLRVQSGKY